jgi:hypothetical protein
VVWVGVAKPIPIPYFTIVNIKIGAFLSVNSAKIQIESQFLLILIETPKTS